MLKLKHSIHAAAALMLASPICYVAVASADTPMAQAVESAQTPTDHAAIAQRYEKEAASYEKQSAEYEKLAAKYRKMPSNPKVNLNTLAMFTHCESQAKRMKEAAAEAREMAQLHADVAKLTNAPPK